MNDILKVTCFEVLYQRWPSESEENHDKYQSQYPVTGPRIEPGISRVNRKSTKHYAAQCSYLKIQPILYFVVSLLTGTILVECIVISLRLSTQMHSKSLPPPCKFLPTHHSLSSFHLIDCYIISAVKTASFNDQRFHKLKSLTTHNIVSSSHLFPRYITYAFGIKSLNNVRINRC
jgi:hypothetical protein